MSQPPTTATAFWLEHGRRAVLFDLSSAFIIVLGHITAWLLAPIASHSSNTVDAESSRETALQDTAWWSRVITLSVAVLAYYPMSYKSYTMRWRGPYSIIPRMLYGLGIGHAGRPGQGRWSTLLWHHRLLFINTACIFARIPYPSYWAGAAISCMAATAADLAGPAYTQCSTIRCMLHSLQDMLLSASPKSLLQQLLQLEIVRCISVHLSDVMLPGLLLTYLETRAYKKWLLGQQQQQIQANAAAASALMALEQPGTSAAAGAGNSSETHSNSSNSSKSDNSEADASPTPAVAAPAGSIAHHAATPAPSRARHPLLYVSPVANRVTSFKFHQPPGTTPEDLDAFKQQLAAAMRAAMHGGLQTANLGPLPAAPTEEPSATTAAAQSLPAEAEQGHMTANQSSLATRPLVTQCSVFPGCYQLVYTTVAVDDTSVPPDLAQLTQIADRMIQQWPGWSLLSIQQHDLVKDGTSAQAGIALEPAVLAASNAVISSSSSGARRVDDASDLDLIVVRSVVQGLVDQGYSSIRAVVIRQPHGMLVRDQEWDLQSLSIAADAACSATTACYKLKLSWEDVLQHSTSAEQHLELGQVLSLVLLAQNRELHSSSSSGSGDDGGGGAKIAPATGSSSLGQQESSMHTASSLSDIQQGAAGPDSQQHTGDGRVIAQLPLLLLPHAAQQEWQQLIAQELAACAPAASAATEDCNAEYVHAYDKLLPVLQDWSTIMPAASAATEDCNAEYVHAYDKLLPVLQDWSTIMLLAQADCQASSNTSDNCTSADRTAAELTTAQHNKECFSKVQTVGAVCDALAIVFSEYGMNSCLSLLQQQQRDYMDSAAATAAACRKQTSPAPPPPPPAPAAVVAAAKDAADAADADCSTAKGLATAKSAEMESAAAIVKTLDTCAGSSSSTGASAVPSPVTHADRATANHGMLACCINAVIWALFGFANPVVEQSYQAYKAASLYRWDLGITLWFILGLLHTLGKLALQQLGTVIQASSDPTAARLLAMRALILAACMLPHAVLWYLQHRRATNHQSPVIARLEKVVRMRSLAMLSEMILVTTLNHVCMHLGGVIAATATAVAQQYHSMPVLQAMFLFVVNPVLYQAGAAVSIPYSWVYYMVLVPLVGGACLLGCTMAEAVLSTVVSGLVLLLLDFRMRAKFCRQNRHLAGRAN